MYYQLTYIIPADSTDPKELEKIITSVGEQVTQAGGAMEEPMPVLSEGTINEKTKTDEDLISFAQTKKASIFKQRLAYHVKHHRYGFFVSNIFNLKEQGAEQILKAIKSQLKADKNILRFILVNFNLEANLKQIENKKKAKPAEEAAAETPIAESKKEARETILTGESKKTKIEDLDKKLEQILNA